ncbi:hypothetical protein DNTS_018867 [Danionella cerebrum]|uniref:SEFIR domain-containing protein n=1 Tax=Danionella cerebrum TaxID=2873325 RepID=A0A553QET4_9TELE|nr:hypothetical protein DNTS_018867 [Danionella translucida]
MAHHSSNNSSLNFPEENDETRSEDFDTQTLSFPHNLLTSSPQPLQSLPQHGSFGFPHPHFSSSHVYQMPFLTLEHHKSTVPSSSSPHSLPSCLYAGFILQEISTDLNSMAFLMHILIRHAVVSVVPHTNIHKEVTATDPQVKLSMESLIQYTQVDACFDKNPCLSINSSQSHTHLPQEQRKVFVTYEADSEEHLKEILKFVALLRHNGFDTHMDVLEQQLNSISKIDCMERYLNQTVSAASICMESDEKTSNTVYIHRQGEEALELCFMALQNEFIQNGCRNYRFIPVLFPGAMKCFVPTWLQNTHVYSWPRDRDDILRRLLRVEKYTPPPIGDLPNIIPIPL